jgi:NAD(P)H dehydrogenase (quinone)
MRIYLLLGHPDKDSFCGAIADAYEASAKAAGHEVRRQDLGALSFDPILHHGYKTIQALEPDLVQAQDMLTWCEHWVLVYPMWWGSVPALLKGFFDRVILPGFAFQPHENDPRWDKLLKGRTGHIFRTADGPNIYSLLAYRDSDIATVKNATMQFCGVSPVKVTKFGGVGRASAEKRKGWLEGVGHFHNSSSFS